MEKSLMKPKLRWNLQYQVQNSFQERPIMAFERNAQKRREPTTLRSQR